MLYTCRPHTPAGHHSVQCTQKLAAKGLQRGTPARTPCRLCHMRVLSAPAGGGGGRGHRSYGKCWSNSGSSARVGETTDS